MNVQFLVLLLAIACASAARIGGSAAAHAASPSPTFPSSLTFGQLAAQIGGPRWDESWQLLDTLKNDSLPHDHLSPFRDSLLRVRDVLDAFVFSFPFTDGQPDIWALAREDLNYGYTWIGNYIDLSNVNYSKQVQEEMLKKIIEWKMRYEQDAAQFNYALYVTQPDPQKFFYRNESELSIMYWGNQTEYVPLANNSGLANIALLEMAMILKHYERYSVLVNFPNLTLFDNAYFMHDYKKQLRAMMTLVRWFPQIYNWSSPYAQSFINISDECHSVLGYTHSQIVSFLYYAENGPEDAAEYWATVVEEAFFEMKQYLSKIAWTDQLNLFRALVVKNPTITLPPYRPPHTKNDEQHHSKQKHHSKHRSSKHN